MRSYARQVPALRRLWGDWHVLSQAYLRGLPDWGHWQLSRRQSKPDSPSAGGDCSSPGRSLHVALASNKVTARELKIAHAIRLHRNRVSLISRQVVSSTAAESFDSCLQADNPWRMLSLIDELRPDVVHALVHEDNRWMLPVLVHTSVPVVYDPYDCLQGMLEPSYQYSRWQLAAERKWFAEADHICARSLEPRYLRRELGYRMPSTTYFPEYCWKEPAQKKTRHLKDDEELHIVYCGGIWPEDRYSKAAAGYAQYIEIGRLLAEQHVHLHLYPAAPPAGMSHQVFFAAYLEESDRNPFFHIYPTLPYPELMRRLPQYDAALHIFGTQIDQSLGSATRHKINYSSANKLFDYMEAGLPVIIHSGRHQRGLIRHYGSSIEISELGQVRQALLRTLGSAKTGKPSAALANHAGRLEVMYRSLVQ